MKGTAIGFLVAGIGGLVATFLVVRTTLPRIEEAWASAGWPTTVGVVVDMQSSRGSGTRVRYRYTVDGREYESRRVRLVERFWADSRSERAALYPEGKRVSVSYDPARPERAVLEPGTTRAAVAKKFVGGGIIALLSLGLISVGVRGLKEERDDVR